MSANNQGERRDEDVQMVDDPLDYDNSESEEKEDEDDEEEDEIDEVINTVAPRPEDLARLLANDDRDAQVVVANRLQELFTVRDVGSRVSVWPPPQRPRGCMW